MDLSKLKNVRKLRLYVASAIAAAGSIKQHELLSLAKKAGFILDGQRGKENVYVHSFESSAPTLSIPDHGRDPRKPLAKGILQRIDEVLFNLEEKLSKQQEVHDELEDQSR
jgi:hypothetical protein